MSRTSSYLVHCIVIGVVMLGAIRLAAAQDKIVTAVDQSVVIARKTQPITNEKANLGTVTKVTQGPAGQTTNVLIYVPPPGGKDLEGPVYRG